MDRNNEDTISMRNKIEAKISDLETARNSIFGASQLRATAKANLAKEIAKTILKLRNGVIYNWEGQDIKSLPANLIPKVAEGICWNEVFTCEDAETGYKSIVVCMDSLKAELNGYQTLNKHLD